VSGDEEIGGQGDFIDGAVGGGEGRGSGGWIAEVELEDVTVRGGEVELVSVRVVGDGGRGVGEAEGSGVGVLCRGPAEQTEVGAAEDVEGAVAIDEGVGWVEGKAGGIGGLAGGGGVEGRERDGVDLHAVRGSAVGGEDEGVGAVDGDSFWSGGGDGDAACGDGGEAVGGEEIAAEDDGGVVAREGGVGDGGGVVGGEERVDAEEVLSEIDVA
jgi:hypothetical protein